MLFNSIQFFLFFPIVTLLYFIIPHRFRWLLLLAASCYFYMAFIWYFILILVFTIVVDYYVGIGLENEKDLTKRKRLLILSIIANIGILAVFKYYNFLNQIMSDILIAIDQKNPIPMLSLVLPIGLSFHTFQALSYTIEVYRGNIKAERHFGIYALYVMFYPQLVAGPIERPQNILHQFYTHHYFNYNDVTSGLKLMAWGLFKKMVIADRISLVVDGIYTNPEAQSGFTCVVGTMLFAIQIYCDFSGYSDIAIGAARVMGIKLMENFKRPYHSQSVSEFWQRWHISLSTWFRDYLYIPLGGSKVAIPHWYFNLFITFLMSGLWHGAHWNFVIWGGLNGFYLILGLWTAPLRNKIVEITKLNRLKTVHTLLNVALTFSLICISWVFFRATSFDNAMTILMKGFSWASILNDIGNKGIMTLINQVFEQPNVFGGKWITFFALGILLVVEYLQIYGSLTQRIASYPLVIRWIIYYIFIIILFLLSDHSNRQFIYFQF